MLLGVVLLGALALRLVAIGDPLSNDEGYTWVVTSAHAPGLLLDRLAAYENTPPLYYLLTWPLPDAGVAWLRIVAVLAGTGCVAAVWWVAQVTRSTFATHSVVDVDRVAIFAAAALAVAPFAVSYSDYARGFVLADLALVVALGAALRERWWLYALAATVALYSEYDSALFLIALALAVGWRRRAVALRVLAPIAALALWLPEALRDSATKVSPTYPAPSSASLRDTLVRLTFGEHGTAHATSVRWLQLLVVAAVCAWAYTRAPKVLATLAGGTLALHAVTAWIGPDVFAPRYLTELIPLTALTLGYALAGLRARELRVAAAVAIAVLGAGVAVRRTGGSDEPDGARVAHEVAPLARGRVVLTNSAVVDYYLRDLHPRLDRPFGLGPGLEAGCAGRCLIIDDARVAGGPRRGPGPSRHYGPIYVRVLPGAT